MVAHKTPVTLSATERQAQLTRDGKIPAGGDMAPAARPTMTPADIRARLNTERNEGFAAAAARNLVPEHRFPRAATGLKPDDDFDGATMTLESSSIVPYDRNPRRSINPNYDEIKETIRVKGVLNQLTVTRRPNTTNYMVYGGGNTRLKIVQELDREHPGNPLYSHMKVVYRAWRGEADVIAAHLIENEARGDTSFWDKACGLIELKKEMEAETGTLLSSNDVRQRAASLGWKVSRDSSLLYDFAVERLHPIGPWLTNSSARTLKDRIGALMACMTRLDLRTGADAFNQLLAEELALHSSALKANQETNGLGPTRVETDAIFVCTSLEERVANATGTSLSELRKMLTILANNPQASASQLRVDAAKGVVVARATPKPVPVAGAIALATQIQLPTPMLAAVRAPAFTTPVDDTGLNAAQDAGLPSIENQGELPPELAPNADVVSLGPTSAAVEAAHALLDALRDLAARTYNADLLVVAPRMPLGYFMELPQGPLQPNATSTLPSEQQIRLRRAGWQLLATLSCQLDHRCCNEPCLPEGSSWLQAVRSGGSLDALWRCGMTVDDGRIQLDAECLFYILTEPRLLSPAVLQVLSSLAVRRGTLPNLLPPQLELVTAMHASAA